MSHGNLLAHELSPYLLQHAHNPVAWRPWSPEAFEEAARRDVPVLVSIGYSACHWCHVMERESFDDHATAERMNSALVCIKVDREERPDIDALHMEYVQRLTGRGGWPLNVFLTPGGVPFFGGTYFPPDPHRGIPSWLEVVEAVTDAYRERKDQILAGAEELARELATTPRTTGTPSTDAQIREGVAMQIASLDPVWGGFPGAPKFPPHSFLMLALSLPSLSTQEESLLRTTLDRMASGGIRDHVEGGFARYSTDSTWTVPHFEKMLCDNAQLVATYAQAAARLSEPRYGRIARETAAWMRRDLGDPSGGFRSSLDADSDGREGAYYTWSWKELEMLLGNELKDFARLWKIAPGGNFEGENVLWTDDLAHAETEGRAERWRGILERSRTLRERPGLDDKVLASWNGLAISGLARAAARLDDPALLEEARLVAGFCRTKLRHHGGLWSVWKNGNVRNAGTLEDWSFLGEGYLELWQSTGEIEWLDEASDAADQILERFSDSGSPLLRFTDRSSEELFADVSPLQDNATPSGNASAARLFAKLWHLSGKARHRKAAEAIAEAAGEAVASFPRAFSALAEVRRLLSPEVLLVHLSGIASDPDFEAMRGVLQRGSVVPDVLVLGARAPVPGILRDGFCGTHGSASDPAVWICRGDQCLPPIRSASELEGFLASIR